LSQFSLSHSSLVDLEHEGVSPPRRPTRRRSRRGGGRPCPLGGHWGGDDAGVRRRGVLRSSDLHTGSFHSWGRDTAVDGRLRRVEIYGGTSMAVVVRVLLFDLRPRVHDSGGGAGPPRSMAAQVLLYGGAGPPSLRQQCGFPSSIYDGEGPPPQSTSAQVLLLYGGGAGPPPLRRR
jgi:hypothetical protein